MRPSVADPRGWHGQCLVRLAVDTAYTHLESATALDPNAPVDSLVTNPRTVPSGIGARTARLELAEPACEEVVVVDEAFHPIGVFGNEAVLGEWYPDVRLPGWYAPASGDETDPEGWPLPIRTPTRVDDLMVPVRALVAAGSSISAACQAMMQARCTRALVVSSAGRLIGVLTASAVRSWISQPERAPAGSEHRLVRA